MKLSRANGVLRGLHRGLSPADISYLEREFATFGTNSFSWRVTKAGQYISQYLEKEDSLDTVLKIFRTHFRKLLRSPRDVIPGCCTHHRNQAGILQKRLLGRKRNWLITFLDVFAATSDLQAYLPGFIITWRTVERLSRFMLLDNFINCHTNRHSPKARARTAAAMAHLLSPDYSPGRRYDTLFKLRRFGTLVGDVGLYPCPSGVRKNITKCNKLKPFGTFTDEVFALSPDRSSAEEVLTKLGLPFDKDQYWIELQYPANLAGIPAFDGKQFLCRPTVVDARGNWAFLPERNHRHGWGRNLTDSSRGLPEIIHEPVPMDKIEDAIVWPITKYGWGDRTSLL